LECNHTACDGHQPTTINCRQLPDLAAKYEGRLGGPSRASHTIKVPVNLPDSALTSATVRN